MVEQPRTKSNCAGIRLRPRASTDYVVRCLLELPTSGGSEFERATKAKEVKCWRCRVCDDTKGTGCPSEQGAWNSGVYITNADGCGSRGWDMQYMQMVVNPGWVANVIKFEVCSDTGCFDQAYEERKAAKALNCGEKTADVTRGASGGHDGALVYLGLCLHHAKCTTCCTLPAFQVGHGVSCRPVHGPVCQSVSLAVDHCMYWQLLVSHSQACICHKIR
jgi:hypothetical protein